MVNQRSGNSKKFKSRNKNISTRKPKKFINLRGEFEKKTKKLKRFGKFKNLLFEILQISQEVNPFKN
jgi:hypothetical protein